MTINWVSFPYAKPGETFVGPTIVLRAHEGGWQEGAAIYRQWFEKAYGLVDSREHWLRRETAFLDTMFLLPEDNINLTFRDIPAWAKTAADHGIGSVMISGWQVGGHDRGYPNMSPTRGWARTTNWKRASGRVTRWDCAFTSSPTCRAWTSRTDWYKKELYQYEIQDPWGAPYFICGWGMGTVGARKG